MIRRGSLLRFITLFACQGSNEQSFLKKMGQPRPLLLFIFGLYKQTIIFLHQIHVKMSVQYMVLGIEPTTFGT